MAAFTSGVDAILLAIAYYEREKRGADNFSRWAAYAAKDLLAMGYIVDVSEREHHDALHHYRITPAGDEYLKGIMTGTGRDPNTIPGLDFQDLRARATDIRDDQRHGRSRIALPYHYRKEGQPA